MLFNHEFQLLWIKVFPFQTRPIFLKVLKCVLKCSSAWRTKSFAYSIVLSCLITEQKVPRAYEEVRKFEDDLKDDLEENTRERFQISNREMISELWRKISVWWRIDLESMRTGIQFLQDNFLALKILYFRNSTGFYLHRVEILELDISKYEQKKINFI